MKNSIVVQNTNIKIKKFDLSHDRFLIIDDNEVCHVGASLKDLGKKWFTFFTKMDIESFEMSIIQPYNFKIKIKGKYSVEPV